MQNIATMTPNELAQSDIDPIRALKYALGRVAKAQRKVIAMHDLKDELDNLAAQDKEVGVCVDRMRNNIYDEKREIAMPLLRAACGKVLNEMR